MTEYPRAVTDLRLQHCPKPLFSALPPLSARTNRLEDVLNDGLKDGSGETASKRGEQYDSGISHVRQCIPRARNWRERATLS